MPTEEKRRNPLANIAFYILVLVILVYLVFPFLWALRSALTPDKDLFATPISYIPHHPTLDHFRAVFKNDVFVRALLNSTIVAASVTILSLIVGSFAAYALGRFRFRGRSPMLYIVLSMTMFPQIAVLGSLFDMVQRFHLYNTLWALILTYLLFTLPFTVWVLTTFFEAMPRELEEAAYVDGATPFQTYYKVLLPLALPGMVTTGLLAFIAAWNEFLYALSFLQTPAKYTVTLALYTFQSSTSTGSSFEVPWGDIMAATVVVMVPLVVLTLVFQRKILAGLTAGAVKG